MDNYITSGAESEIPGQNEVGGQVGDDLVDDLVTAERNREMAERLERSYRRPGSEQDDLADSGREPVEGEGGDAEFHRAGESLEYPGAPDNPMLVAQTILSHTFLRPDGFGNRSRASFTDGDGDNVVTSRGLHHAGRSWYLWSGAGYRELPGEDGNHEVESQLWEILDHSLYTVPVQEGQGVNRRTRFRATAWKPSIAKIHNVHRAMQSVCRIPAGAQVPCWVYRVSGSVEPAEPGNIACQNAVVNVITGQVLRQSPEFFTTWGLDFSYDPEAKCPEWEAFLESIFGGDRELKDLLADWFWYVLSGRLEEQKFMYFIGPTGSGKSTIARVLVAMLGGTGNVGALKYSSFFDQFGLQQVPGKPLAIVSDMRQSYDPKTMQQVVEQILTLTGGDSVQIDRKHISQYNGYLPTRFMIMSNEMPRFNDPAGAISRRLLVLPFTRSFAGREDTGLTQRLLGELPGILNWALAARGRMTSTGFTCGQRSLAMAQEISDKMSPYAAFIRDCCDLGDQLEEGSEFLFQRFAVYCDERDLHAGNSSRGFLDKLHAVNAGIQRDGAGWVRDRDGQRVKGFTGIRFRGAVE